MRRQEPCTITGKVVADELEHLGFERMAGFVRRLDDQARSHNLQVRDLTKTIGRLLDRLHVYEPARPMAEGRSYRAGAESDG